MCGIILSPAIWQQEVNEALEEEWFGEDYKPKSSFWVSYFERLNNRRTLRRLIAQTNKRGRLLEIGVGSGSFLHTAKKCGFDVMGCDLSASLCNRATQQYGVPMHCGFLSELTGENRYEVIVMNHVLEHVTDPIEFLRDVRRLLTPDGVAHIVVPNVKCWEAGLTGWTSYEPYHLSYFAPATLQQAVNASGLKINQLLTYESFSGWILTIFRTVLRVNNPDRVTNINVKRTVEPLQHHRVSMLEHAYRATIVAIGIATWPLRRVQAWLHYGDEVICLVKK